MKPVTFLICLLMLGSSLSEAQPEKFPAGPFEKMKELEKIKLIETLDMDEETTLKFFSRRNEHLQRLDDLNKQRDDKQMQINERIKNSDENDPRLVKLVDDYLAIQGKFETERKDFINNVRDILSSKQIAKLIVFERKFREEVREIIFKQRKRGMD